MALWCDAGQMKEKEVRILEIAAKHYTIYDLKYGGEKEMRRDIV